ncbi:MAG TPA: DUF3995 domain-containing protein [Acidimicrobiales bacterium]
MCLLRRAATGVLLALAGLHVAWGVGSSFPFANRERLADAVVGAEEVPPRAACFVVAAALLVGAAALSEGLAFPTRLRIVVLRAMVVVLGIRSFLGFLGVTRLISPGSTSSTFRHRDRKNYSPLTLALAYATFRTLHSFSGTGDSA